MSTTSQAARLAEEKHKRDYRRARRKSREAAGEIRELNIVAMMDMMTILLVFLLKSYQASTVNVNMGEGFQMPASTTQLSPQENITIKLSMHELVVNDRKVFGLQDGVLPADVMQGSSYDIDPLHGALVREVERQKQIAKYNASAPFSGRLNVVADKHISYDTLKKVLYTAAHSELGEFKFTVLKANQ